jgi:hypothetical protein
VLTTPTWTVPHYKGREENYRNNISVDQGKHNNAQELRGQGRLWLIYLQNITNCCFFCHFTLFLLLLFPFWEGVPPIIRSRWLGMPPLHLLLRSAVLQPVVQTCDRAEVDVYSHKSPRPKDVSVYKGICYKFVFYTFHPLPIITSFRKLFIIWHIQSSRNS